MGGAGMLHNQGVTHKIISKELKQMRKHSKKKRN
jgi:hypothetical protein